ncbi:MAG: VWA domain-containing protein [Candidatus Nanoarchaeia archaeon]
MYITFTNPQFFYLFVLVPVLVIFYFINLRSSKKRALKFANFDAIARIKGVEFFSRNLSLLIMTNLIVTLMILSLSGPILTVKGEFSSSSFVVAIDSSKSMTATDIYPNRLESAKKVSLDFVDSAPASAKMSILSFSGNTFIEQEMTSDKYRLKQGINSIEINDIDGTDIVEAVFISNNLLQGEKSKSLLILSDGQLNIGDLDEAIEYSRKNNLVIYSFAIGTIEGGATDFGISRVDLDSLKALSYNTEGLFFEINSTEALEDYFRELLKLKTGNVEIDISKHCIIAAIVLYFLMSILSGSRRIFI